MAKAKEQPTLAEQLAAEARQHAADLESILESIAEADRLPGVDELVLLNARYGLDGTQIKSELRRVRSKLHHRAVAGCKADRAKARELVASTAAALQTEGAKLQAEIEERQKQLGRLERDAQSAVKRLEEMCTSCKMLSDLESPSVRKERSIRRAAIKETLGVVVSDMEIRKTEIEGAITRPAQSDRMAMHWVDQWRRRCPEAFVKNGNDGWEMTPRFAEECDKLKAELAEIKAKLPEAKAKFEQALSELEPEL